MRGMRVTGYGHLQLSNCFSDQAIANRIRVTVRPQLVGSRYDAVYNSAANKISLRSPNVLQTVSGRAMVVHELTHAQFDLRSRPISILSEEGAAYVAQGLYMLFCNASLEDIDQQVTEEIRDIAVNMRIDSSYPYLRTAEMTADQINTVRRVVHRSFGYRTGQYLSNGIGGLRYREL